MLSSDKQKVSIFSVGGQECAANASHEFQGAIEIQLDDLKFNSRRSSCFDTMSSIMTVSPDDLFTLSSLIKTQNLLSTQDQQYLESYSIDQYHELLNRERLS